MSEAKTVPGNVNMSAFLAKAQELEADLTKFLVDIVSIPSLSAEEGAVVARIAEEMRRIGYDEVKIDGLGNVIGRIGDGPRVIAFDGHIDTVDVGNRGLWTFDPHEAHVRDGRVWGRGTADQKGGFASAVYGMRILKELGVDTSEYTLLVTGTVMEEDCDGLCWNYLIEEEGLKPEVAVLTEPTSLRVYRGQRGRMEMEVVVDGVSSHGSAPERGDNAVYKMARVVGAIEALNEDLADDGFLGKGTVVVSEFSSTSPSQCAVPDQARIYLDRRMTWGETEETAVAEIEACLGDIPGEVSIPTYERVSHTGLTYPMKKVYPVWKTPESHPAILGAARCVREVLDVAPVVNRWTFSTNGVTISGVHGIPSVGFGPGNEEQAHTTDEWIEISDLVRAAAFYAGFPFSYSKEL